MNDVTNGPSLIVMTPDETSIKWMPPVMDDDFLFDMGRVTRSDLEPQECAVRRQGVSLGDCYDTDPDCEAERCRSHGIPDRRTGTHHLRQNQNPHPALAAAVELDGEHSQHEHPPSRLLVGPAQGSAGRLGSSLGGVTLANRSAEKRLRHQFENDRTSRISEREFALRRDVYLGASEAISAAIASIGRFADVNVPVAALSQVVIEKVPVLGKVQTIAGAEVLQTPLKN